MEDQPAGDSRTRRRAQQSGRNAALVGAGIFLSRMSGIIREVALRGYLGTSASADAFGAGLQIPKVLQNLLGEGSLSASFIPVYSQMVDADEREAGRLAGAVAGLITLVTAVAVFLGIILARPLTRVLAPGFTGEKFELTVELTRIMIGGIGFIVLAAWCLGVLNSHRKFFLSYVAPVIWNAAIITAVVFAGVNEWTGAEIAEAAAWGVLIGGLLQFLIQLPAVIRTAPQIRLSVSTKIPGVALVARRFGPAVVARGIVTLTAYIDLILASLLATGAVAVLGAAQVLYLMPISVFALSVAAAELPELSRETDKRGIIFERLDLGIQRVSYFMVYSAIAFVTMGPLIVSALFQRGEFTSDDSIVVWLTVATFAFGLIPAGLSRLLQNTCYAIGDVKGPAKIAGVRALLAVGIGAVLMFQFDQIAVIDGTFYQVGDLPNFSLASAEAREFGDYARLGAVGLAAGAAISAWVELALLQKRVHGSFGFEAPIKSAVRRLTGPGVVTAVLGVILTVLLWSLPRILGAILAIGVSGAIYTLLANRGGNPAASGILRPFRRVLWGQRPLKGP
jgi:putative peptidoglycan lipid II flippase